MDEPGELCPPSQYKSAEPQPEQPEQHTENRQPKKGHFVYMVRCADETLYTGWTTDVSHRVAEHNAGRGAKYTRTRRPVTLCFVETCNSKSEALKREWAIKQLTRRQKLALIEGNIR